MTRTPEDTTSINIIRSHRPGRPVPQHLLFSDRKITLLDPGGLPPYDLSEIGGRKASMG